jgi:microtubule-associated protein-like 1/2
MNTTELCVCVFVQEAVQSACFSPDGSVIVVGTILGHWFALSAETREIISHHNDGSEPIQVSV